MTDFAFSLEVPGAPDPVTGAVDGSYTHNAAHTTELQGHLIEYFQRTRNMAVLAAIGAQLQEIEDALLERTNGRDDALWALLYAFDVDTATGDQLEKLGIIVGEAPLGRTEEDFRSAIRARILINQSDGHLEQLIEIAVLLFPTARVRVTEYPPASLAVEFVGDLGTLSHSNISRLLKQAKAGGVRLDTIVSPTAAGVETGFVWDPGTSAAVASTGWGSGTDVGVGATWTSVL